MDPKGSTIIAGFEDGVVRVITVTKIPDRASGRRGKQDCEVTLEQAFKPHSKKVASLDIDSKGEILASGVWSRLFSIHLRKMLTFFTHPYALCCYAVSSKCTCLRSRCYSFL